MIPPSRSRPHHCLELQVIFLRLILPLPRSLSWVLTAVGTVASLWDERDGIIFLLAQDLQGEVSIIWLCLLLSSSKSFYSLELPSCPELRVSQ